MPWPLSNVAIIGIALLLALAFQGSRALFDPDEGRYADIALQMLASHEFITPRVNPEHAHYAKPPLAYWLLAASFATFGRNEWAARLPNALALVLTAACILRLGRCFLPRAPTLPALVWLTMLAPVTFANIVTPDTLLALWETLAMTLCVSALSHPAADARARLFGFMWIAWGLAFLTKGPPGLLPLLGVFVVLALRADMTRLRELASPVGMACLVVVGLSWFALTAYQKPDLLEFYLRDEVFGRIFTARHDRHSQWYGALVTYLPTLVIGALPWWPFAIPAMRGARELAGRTFWRDNSVPLHRPLLVTWFAIPLLVFVLARSRLATYVLPLFVPLAILIAQATAARVAALSRLQIQAALGAWIIALVILKAAGSVLPSEKNASTLADEVTKTTDWQQAQRFVFVETTPSFGLGFYLHREVEAVRLTRNSHVPYTTPADTVCNGLGQGPFAIVLVPQALTEQFVSTVRQCHRRSPVLSGKAGRYAVFVDDVRLPGVTASGR